MDKKDYYYQGKIYQRVDVILPESFWDAGLFLQSFPSYDCPSPHPFKDGEDVTGKYEIGYQYQDPASKEWFDCTDWDDFETDNIRREVASPLPLPSQSVEDVVGKEVIEYRESPIHYWFELSHAQYLTIPRSILEAMPHEWQERMTKCLEELDEQINWRPKEGRYWCRLKNDKGHFVTDPLMQYRHPDTAYINSLKTP